jgi:hypothetical protein
MGAERRSYLLHGESRLSEETERSKCRRTGAVLVWNNRETEVADLVEVESLFFALVGGSPGAEVVLLNQDLAIRSASIPARGVTDGSAMVLPE